MAETQDAATPLPTVPLGRTGMRITRVGLGAWALGGAGWAYSLGRQDDRDSIATIRHAVAAGVNWIDTAAVYGLGHSEEIVGRALKDVPEAQRPFVFTKGGLVWDPADPTREPRRVGHPASLRREVEDSLRRLDVERIDLYQMHWPADDLPGVEDYWPTFLELQQEGKVRAVGLSNHDVGQLEAAEALGHVDTLQPLFNAINRDAAADVVPWCAAHDTGVIVYSPLAKGLLSGAYTEARCRALDAADAWRNQDPDFQDPALGRNLALTDALRPVAERRGVSLAAVAVAWTLAFPISGAMVGARRPEQVDGWIAAARLELDASDLDDIADAIRRTGAGSGPPAP
jgi:aryl-alcohol dehydrogenase-like predicted oxidoreductase